MFQNRRALALNETIEKLPSMYSKGLEPLLTLPVNGKYLLSVYQGKLSKFDLLLKYREKDETGKWSYIRTPKHIHWAVDILIKLSLDESNTKNFLDFLINHWDNNVKSLKSVQEREDFLSAVNLLKNIENESKQYEQLAGKGRYSIRFLILMAKILMVQEKTNYEEAYMFKNLLDALKKGNDIFKIVSIATHG
jgi:hypothetical protein